MDGYGCHSVFKKMQTLVEGKSSGPLQWGFMSLCCRWNPKAPQCCAESSTHPLPGCQNPPHTGPRRPATLCLWESSEMQIFHTLSARLPWEARVWWLSPLTACPPTHLQTGCSWGPCGAVLGGRPPPPPRQPALGSRDLCFHPGLCLSIPS